MDNYLVALVLSVLPISELRGGIIYGVTTGLPLLPVAVLCTLANVLLVIPLYYFLDFFYDELMKIKIFKNYVNKTHKKISAAVNKYGFWGLTLFVAVPLPMTGAYTAMVGSFILGLSPKKSMLATALGVLIAGIIVSLILYTGTGLFGIRI